MHSTVIWPIERFRPYEKNPRKNDHVVDQMVASIREFGFKIPMLSRSDGEVVDGHLRLKAALKLGLQELPTILCDEWTPAQVKAFRIMVNKSVEWADWDTELLNADLAELKELDFDLSLTGFDLPEVDGLLTGTWEPPVKRVAPAAMDPIPAQEEGFPALASGEKPPFQQITFTLHDLQAEQVKAAMDAAKGMGEFVDSPNANSNGNALARICETFLTEHANG